MNLHQRIYFLGKLFLYHFILFSLFRVAFFFAFKATATPYTQDDLLQAVYLGAKFDIRLAFIAILPAWVIGYFPYLNPIRDGKSFWIWIYTIFSVLFCIGYLADFGHYGYLNSRLNGSVFQYLANPLISLQMLWQSYPIASTSIALLLGAVLIRMILKQFVFFDFEYKNISRTNQGFQYLLFFVLFAGGIYGKISTFPLRWSEAFFSQNTFISALALNPIIYLAETYKYSAPIYNEDEVRKYYPLMADFLGVPKSEQNIETLNFKRTLPSTVNLGFRPNILVIVMESMSMSKTDLTNNPLESTPALKKIAQESWYFDEFYVPSEGTARSMFALMTSAADVTGYKTASRNPLIIDQNLVVNYFSEDYEKYYFLGGNANWGQIRGVFTNNIKNVKVIEEGHYDSPIVDVWGISDLDLFKESFKKLSEQPKDKPFFAVIQTAGFHRPYTIPDNRDDFEVKELPEEDVKKAGFISTAEWNAMRFADYSLGRFLEMFKNSPMYEDTIIVILGDHGLPDENAEHISLPRRKVEIEKFHVPLIIHNPKALQPRKDSRIATELDVMVTLANLSGVDVEHAALGRDLLDPKFDDTRMAFTYFHYAQPAQYGMYFNNYYYSVKGSKEELFHLDPKSEFQDVSKENPAMTEYLKTMAHGYFETAKYILYHNKKLTGASE